MKLVALALLPVAFAATPAAAQSLHETHERVWMPSGKAPMLVWRMRDRSAQVASNGHHQAGKGQMPVAVRSRPDTGKIELGRRESEATSQAGSD